MQIKKILLYKENKNVRELSFEIGKLNIITGESKSGKTAIIDIINYCLGSSSCDVKGDKIIHVVEYFGLILQLSEMQILIIRQNPFFISKDSTNDIYFKYEKTITNPEYNEIIPNSNVPALLSFLTDKMNIGDNLNIPEFLTRDSLSANFKHSRIFCYQPQNVIAEFKYLFFNQDESWVEQAIKDTFPYFLGAIHNSELFIKNEIRDLTRKLNRLYRKRSEFESLKQEGFEQLDSLIEEAVELNLIDVTILTYSNADKIDKLNLLNNNSVIEGVHNLGENERLNELLDQKEKLKRELDDIYYEIKSTENFLDNTSKYQNEVLHQQARLVSIGLFKESNDRSEWNALLGDYSDYLPPSLVQLNESLVKLKNNLEVSNKGTPKFTEYLEGQKNRYNEIDGKITKIKVQIKSIYKKKEELDSIRNENIRKGKVLGKIEIVLDSINKMKPTSILSDSIAALEAKKLLLESKINNETTQDNLESALNRINHTMTSWSNRINFEYQNTSLRFSIKKLTMIAETEKGALPLNRIGGAENWLACHLFVHLALHKYFVEKQRPVPHFLILDQPTQVHYPDNYTELPGKFLPSQDEQADIQMFDFLLEFVKDLAPDFQIIVTDHAHFHYKKFEDCVQEVWRNGKKLIPVDWYE